MLKKAIKKAYETFTHLIGKMNGKYYFEDYIRVYPGAAKFDRFGKQIPATKNDINNFKNHSKFYNFTTQFVRGKKVADIGCGSGYGCEIIKNAGATHVFGVDVSKASIEFSIKHFGKSAEFSIASITDIKTIKDNSVDITINSEVMEHIKEYNMESKAMEELKRITINNGLIIISTPNTELLNNHGFSFDEINTLFKNNFKQYCIFENALYPATGKDRILWEKRLKDGSTGIIINETINFDDTVLPSDTKFEIKKGIDPGVFQFVNYKVNTALLHNTHSWIVLAINEK